MPEAPFSRDTGHMSLFYMLFTYAFAVAVVVDASARRYFIYTERFRFDSDTYEL